VEGSNRPWRLEALKLRFETYKHLTTLQAAVPLLTVVLSGDLSLNRQGLILALTLIGVGLFWSVLGMLREVMNIARAEEQDYEVPRERPLPPWRLFVACFLFLAGMYALATAVMLETP
jgi:hypothetical protein